MRLFLGSPYELNQLFFANNGVAKYSTRSSSGCVLGPHNTQSEDRDASDSAADENRDSQERRVRRAMQAVFHSDAHCMDDWLLLGHGGGNCDVEKIRRSIPRGPISAQLSRIGRLCFLRSQLCQMFLINEGPRPESATSRTSKRYAVWTMGQLEAELQCTHEWRDVV